MANMETTNRCVRVTKWLLSCGRALPDKILVNSVCRITFVMVLGSGFWHVDLSSAFAQSSLVTTPKSVARSSVPQTLPPEKLIENRSIAARLLLSLLRELQYEWAKDHRTPPRLRLSHCTIQGDLHARDLVVPCDLQFRDCIFTGSTDWEGTTFKKSTSFSGSTFVSDAVFDKATFDASADFSEASFSTSCSFRSAVFNQKSYFSGLIMDGDFDHTIFTAKADFNSALFEGTLDFTDANFKERAYFLAAKFRKMRSDPSFERTTFAGIVYFQGVSLQTCTLSFIRTRFQGDVFLTNLDGPDSGIDFIDLTFQGRVFLDGLRLHQLKFSSLNEPNSNEATARLFSPTTFEKTAVFRGLKCDIGDFQEANFRGYADFSSARFERTANFNSVSFEADVNFYATRLPPNLYLDDIRFEKAVYVRWSQLTEYPQWWQILQGTNVKVKTNKIRTWETLDQVFVRANDIDGHIEATFQKRLLAPNAAETFERENRLTNWLSLIWWGYGFRPWQLVGWLFVAYLLFACICRHMDCSSAIQDDLMFTGEEIKNPVRIARRIIESCDLNNSPMWDTLSQATRQQLLRFDDPTLPPDEFRAQVATILNELSISDTLCPATVVLRAGQSEHTKVTGAELVRRNRQLILGTFTAEISEEADSYVKWRTALAFSRRASFSIDYGVKNARTPSLKTIAIVYSIVFKIMLFFLVAALTNVSPFLKDLIGKLLPI